MRKLRYAPLILAAAILLSCAPSAARAQVLDEVKVVKYCSGTDYMREILKAVEDGGAYALEMAAIYEAQRNLKIDTEGLEAEKTDFFSRGLSLKEIRGEVYAYMYPEPQPRYPLTAAERALVESVVMAESGGQSYKGQLMVAQCILDGTERNGFTVAETIRRYGYTGSRPRANESVKSAVAAVFDRGERVTEEKADLFYNPGAAASAWHESQIYVCTIGAHRFFRTRGAMAA